MMPPMEPTDAQQRLIDAVWAWVDRQQIPSGTEERLVAALGTCSPRLLKKTGMSAALAWKSLSADAAAVALNWSDHAPSIARKVELPMSAAEALANPRAVRRACAENQERFWRKFGVNQSAGSRYECGREIRGATQLLIVLYAVGAIDDERLRRWAGVDADNGQGLSEKQRAAIKEALEDPRALRRRRRLTQTEFWGPLGFTQSGGCRYEQGRTLPKPLRLLLIGRELGEIDEKALAELGEACQLE